MSRSYHLASQVQSRGDGLDCRRISLGLALLLWVSWGGELRAQTPASAASYRSVGDVLRGQPQTTTLPVESSSPRVVRTAADPSSAGRPTTASLPAPLPDAVRPPLTPARLAEVPGPQDPESAALDAITEAARPLTLPEAIDLAFQTQPRLRAQLETIEQARGLQGIAYSAFLPIASGGYRAGGVDLHTGGSFFNRQGGSSSGTTSGGTSAGFSALPEGGIIPGGLVIESAFELAELNLQWLILDFGRRLAAFEQAKLAGEIARLQTSRAFQTVASDVATAYFAALRAQALRRASQDAIRRTQADLIDARKQAREGLVIRETVLRVEVLAAEARQALRLATEEEYVALASLNLAIGLKGRDCIRVVPPGGIEELTCSLDDCLRSAVDRRFEFQVARRTMEIASEGTKQARAEFAPKVFASGYLLNLQQASPTIFADQVAGSITLDWKLFEGGRKVATLRIADAKLREAMAQVEVMADTIAFQVIEAYRRSTSSRLGIEDARPAVDQAHENYRLVRARALEGNATPTEMTDALATVTRAEQNYASALYAYYSARSKLEYAMGTGRTPPPEAIVPIRHLAPVSRSLRPAAGPSAGTPR